MEQGRHETTSQGRGPAGGGPSRSSAPPHRQNLREKHDSSDLEDNDSSDLEDRDEESDDRDDDSTTPATAGLTGKGVGGGYRGCAREGC